MFFNYLFILTGLSLMIISPCLAKTASTLWSLSNVMKPKPRGRPVSLLDIKVDSTTVPNWEKYSLNSSSVTSGLTPPTKIFSVFSCSSRGIARFGSIYLFINLLLIFIIKIFILLYIYILNYFILINFYTNFLSVKFMFLF